MDNKKEKALLLSAETYRQALVDIKSFNNEILDEWIDLHESKIKYLKEKINPEKTTHENSMEYGIKVAIQKVLQAGHRFKQMGYKYDKHDPFESIINDLLSMLKT